LAQQDFLVVAVVPVVIQMELVLRGEVVAPEAVAGVVVILPILIVMENVARTALVVEVEVETHQEARREFFQHPVQAGGQDKMEVLV
tara:strand:+ start:767 stop:1027 length:261 start_codon:yes stop_codon:yes gene_type:complete